jgi:hypothetical protein
MQNRLLGIESVYISQHIQMIMLHKMGRLQWKGWNYPIYHEVGFLVAVDVYFQ